MRKLFIILIALLLVGSALAIDCNFKAESMEKILIPLDQDLICEGTAITFNNISGGVLDCQNFSLEGKVLIENSRDFEIINCNLTKDQLIINNLNNSMNKMTQSIKQDIKKQSIEQDVKNNISEKEINESTYETNKKIDDKNYSLFWSLLVLIILLLLLFFVFIYFKKNN